MRALVTGACGFVGGYLIKHLQACGDQVLGTVLPKDQLPAAASPRDFFFEHVELDIGDAEQCTKILARFQPDVVYHLAGLAFVPECEKDFSRALLINVGGTHTIYKVAHLLERDMKVVLISSAEVYGTVSERELPLTESSPTKPANNYSLSKLMAEAVAERYARLGRVRSVIFRPFNHIGAGQNNRFVASSFAFQLARIAKNQMEPVLKVGNLDVRRDFSDVRDVVCAYRLGAEKGAGIYNLGSGQAIPIYEMLETLISVSGLEVEVRQDPDLVRPSDNPVVFGSYQKAKKELGWEPTYNLRETVREIYEYWLARV